MEAALGIIIAALISIFVYLDATRHNIGAIKGKKGFFNMTAGGWAACTLLFTVIYLTVYLFKRKKLILAAKEFPVHASGLKRFMTVLLILLVGFAFLYLDFVDRYGA